ncbi:MAG: energy transducer TonB [Lewinellaceae bacterium]|nr:energy transducer TonB [Lewinellaceae bacterium]
MQTKHNVHATWLLSAAFSLLFALPLSAQKTAAKPENQPEYPGGMPALIDYMVQNIKYPEAAKKEQATGMVLVRFTVEKDGHISGIKTITEGSQNPREDFVRESVRVIKGMPNWTPAKTDGKIVSAEVTLPIKFALDGKKP